MHSDPASRPARRRSWPRRLALGAVTNVIVLGVLAVLGEVAGQVHARRRPAFDVLGWQADPVLGWRLVPGLEFTWAGHGWYAREFSVPVRVNALGFRDRERTPGKAGALRVALLGDSYFEGIQVPLEEACATRLEALLAARTPGAEVLNFGVSNYGVGQALLTWEHVAHGFAPDWVVVLVSELTLGRTVRASEEGAFPTTRGRSLQIRPSFALHGDGLVLRPARDAGALRELQGALLASEFSGQRSRRRPPRWFLPERLREVGSGLAARSPGRASPRRWISDETWSVNRRVLTQLARSARAAGARVAVLDVCTWLNAGAKDVELELRALCREQGMVHVDGSEALRAMERRGARTRWPIDVHWTAAGHEAVAAALDEAMRVHDAR